MPKMERNGDTNEVSPKRVDTWLKSGWKLVKPPSKVKIDKVVKPLSSLKEDKGGK